MSVRYKCNFCSSLFLTHYYFSKNEQIIKHAFFKKVVILGAYCEICLYMLHIAIYVCTYVGCMLLIQNFSKH